MELVRHTARTPERCRGAVVAIGNFDGIHRGHQELIAKTKRIAEELGAPAAVMTFEPHPREFFKPDQPPFRLTPFRVKLRLLEALDLDILYAVPFNLKLSQLSAEAFAREVLGEALGVRHVIVGDNFRFGHKAAGDVTMLTELGRHHGFGVTGVRRVAGPGEEIYSSTLVRNYLTAGNPTRAALLLGRYWEIEGRVLHGHKRGRELGYPTANIGLGEILNPAFGVYAVNAALDRAGSGNGSPEWLPGVANVGMSPMFDNKAPLLEVHLFDFDGDLYARHMRVALVDYLRPEMTFDDLEGLTAQMASDSERARQTLAWERWDQSWPAGPYLSQSE